MKDDIAIEGEIDLVRMRFVRRGRILRMFVEKHEAEVVRREIQGKTRQRDGEKHFGQTQLGKNVPLCRVLPSR